MHIFLTLTSLLIGILCLATLYAVGRLADECNKQAKRCELIATNLRNERDRVVVLERESAALRRWIKKIEGKVYADAREKLDGIPHESDPRGLPSIENPSAPFCENYGIAQTEGPLSKAAQCTCNYCSGRRASKAAFRDREVPKTAQAQGELARLNAGKS